MVFHGRCMLWSLCRDRLLLRCARGVLRCVGKRQVCHPHRTTEGTAMADTGDKHRNFHNQTLEEQSMMSLAAMNKCIRDAVQEKTKGILHNGEMPTNIHFKNSIVEMLDAECTLSTDEVVKAIRSAEKVELLRKALYWWVTKKSNIEKFRQKTLDGANIRMVLARLPERSKAALMLQWMLNLEVLTGSETLDIVLSKAGALPHLKKG